MKHDLLWLKANTHKGNVYGTSEPRQTGAKGWGIVVGLGLAALVSGQPMASAASRSDNEGTPRTATGKIESHESQRARAWALLASTVSKTSGKPDYTGWFSEAEVFAPGDLGPADSRLPYPGLPIGAGAPPDRRMRHFGDAPLITFVHYDKRVYEHIRRFRLYREEQLVEIARSGNRDPDFPQLAAIPSLPIGSKVFMSAWWPVAGRGRTPMPIWDPGSETRPNGSNDYPSWRRVVAVADAPPASTTPVSFAGRLYPAAAPVSLRAFVRLPVNAVLAKRLMSDAGSRKAANLILGRPIVAGDFLILVAFHLLKVDDGKGVWATFWWHDRPTEGRFGIDRPSHIPNAWGHYLMDVAFDEVEPREADGSPRICFNPWLEAKFPDGGEGNGLQSNCVNCHNRAGYPTINPLPVRRGLADPLHDPAFAPGRVRTGRLWSLANPGQAGASPLATPSTAGDPTIR